MTPAQFDTLKAFAKHECTAPDGCVPCAVLAMLQRTMEYRNEAKRCRKLASAVLEGADTNGVVIEVGESFTLQNGFGIVLCAPNLDESNLGEAAVSILRDVWEHEGLDPDGPKGFKIGKLRIAGTGADE